MSVHTSTCPSQPAPEPIPIVGTESEAVILVHYNYYLLLTL